MRTPNPLLVESKGASKVRPMPTADAQLYWAVTNPQDEAAWVAVSKFPGGVSDEIKARADVALALIYLKTNRRQLAETTFNDLAIQPKFKVNGSAGLALYADLIGEKETARTLIAKVAGLDGKLFPEMEVALKDLRKRLAPPK